MATDQKIKRIFGHEPPREGEYPTAYIVGDRHMESGLTVTDIKYEVNNYGDHGIGWFVVKAGDVIISEVAARAVSEVQYDTGT